MAHETEIMTALMKVPQALIEDAECGPTFEDLVAAMGRPQPPLETDRRRWPIADLCCPNCGGQRVHAEDGLGDVEVGPTHWCEVCHSEFTAQLAGTWEPEAETGKP